MRVPSGWEPPESWKDTLPRRLRCHSCEEELDLNDIDVVYLPIVDCLFHEHSDGLYRIVDYSSGMATFRIESGVYPLLDDLDELRVRQKTGKGSFWWREDSEIVRAHITLEGITRTDLAERCGIPYERILLIVRELVSTEPEISEERKGTKRLVKKKLLPEFWEKIKPKD